ncbi:MAG TPA: flavin reductase family protein [Myxococcales bacterium]|jgi:flavin reductase (DIM6/NTAB) family NADH-FMN oxidoreductase RutF
MRVEVPLRHAYKLINHGPTTLVTSAAGGRSNVMASAWVGALDTDPPRITAVISADSFTRSLIEKSGEFVVNLPTIEMVEVTLGAGKVSGREADKIAALGLKTADAGRVAAPLIEGCVGWLECRLLDEPAMRERYDLLLAEVVAAWADDRVFVDGAWHFEAAPRLRTLHHVAKGIFLASGERIEVRADGKGVLPRAAVL